PGLRAAPAGRPYTGVWAELPAALAAGAGRITLAEYDARLGYFCVSTLERQSVTEPGGGACDAARSGAVELGAT
ncbi:MAG TPA: hypothetical protein VJT31_42615, partial [Rugosimonospora sp.]|nr:hypothetical protein [Rugosimonospora sp.]